MSVSGISSSSLYSTQNVESSAQQFRQEFQQLGQDLQAGNLSAAQSDFATLQNLTSQNSSATSAQAFSQLAKDLQSGNLSAAQQDFATIQQDFQNQSTQVQAALGHHHHHHGGGGSGEISQLLSQLGTALQSGDLSTAQQAYSSLVQQFQASSSTSAVQTESTAQTGTSGVSITA